MYPKTIQKLINLFSRFPGIGPKTAARFVFYLLIAKKEEVDDLVETISLLKTSLKTCLFCQGFFLPAKEKGQENLCEICSHPARDKKLLCVVEKDTDRAYIEEAKIYKGLYFIIGRSISKLKTEEMKKLKIEELKQRIENPEKFGVSDTFFEEIILALNPTPEGQATAIFLETKLKKLNKKITRLGIGLPVGGELEYTDKETLKSALEKRE